MSKVECNLNVNGLSKKINIYEDKPLIFALRNDFGLTGTKLGCGLEQCGSCAVIIDGEKKLSCNLPAVDCQNKEIVTIEGLGTDTGLNRVQEAFKKFNAAQCGYCTSGIIITISSLLEKKDKPTSEDILNALDGHLCRCGSHSVVLKAIESLI
jgi:aerobic-type carbon monoxide dehydrogenase small subunit (CoxS/CutS family)|tara:strand:- start:316 stop:774 length:459 start_codon:yes stop_codon:yes gene_type:complete